MALYALTLLLALTASAFKLPTVDLSLPEEDCAKQLLNAATQFGFFHVINHKVSTTSMQQALEASKQLFEMDEHQKMQLISDDNHWGYIPFQSEKTDLARQKQGDTKEGFYIQNKYFRQYTSSTGTNHKANQWPPAEMLTDWKPVVINYMNELHSLSERLLQIIALSLHLPRDYFQSPGIRDRALDMLYLLHYHAQTSDADRGIFGNGQHTDYDLFTILLTDQNPGLQILHQTEAGDEWLDVQYEQNAIVVNIADTLQKWTNDVFKSAVHRVVLSGETERYSIPYFVASNYELLIDCLPTTVSEASKCNHEPFISGEYLQRKLEQTHNVYQRHEDL